MYGTIRVYRFNKTHVDSYGRTIPNKHKGDISAIRVYPATGTPETFRLGDRVRVNVNGIFSEPTTISAFYSDIEGGVRLADERFGFWSWNVLDLVKEK